MALLEVKDLRYTYPDGTCALDGVDLTVDPGERVAILGPNGAGKSTLLLHLNGVLLAQSGSVTVDGKLITIATEHWVKSQAGWSSRILTTRCLHPPCGRMSPSAHDRWACPGPRWNGGCSKPW